MGAFSVPFQLVENPFGETPDTRFYFNSKSHDKALKELVRSIAQGKGFSLLTGTIGSGKTLLCRILLKSLHGRVNSALILHPFLTQNELFFAISQEFGLPQLPENQRSAKNHLDQLNEF